MKSRFLLGALAFFLLGLIIYIGLVQRMFLADEVGQNGASAIEETEEQKEINRIANMVWEEGMVIDEKISLDIVDVYIERIEGCYVLMSLTKSDGTDFTEPEHMTLNGFTYTTYCAQFMYHEIPKYCRVPDSSNKRVYLLGKGGCFYSEGDLEKFKSDMAYAKKTGQYQPAEIYLSSVCTRKTNDVAITYDLTEYLEKNPKPMVEDVGTGSDMAHLLVNSYLQIPLSQDKKTTMLQAAGFVDGKLHMIINEPLVEEDQLTGTDKVWHNGIVFIDSEGNEIPCRIEDVDNYSKYLIFDIASIEELRQLKCYGRQEMEHILSTDKGSVQFYLPYDKTKKIKDFGKKVVKEIKNNF